jgi:hypothetical protein
MATGARQTLCVQQMADRSYRVYMGLVAPETIARAGGEIDVNDMSKARSAMLGPGGFFASWAPELRAFVDAAEGPWRAWPLYRLDPDTFLSAAGSDDKDSGRWVPAHDVTLLGDAAHISIPNGEGVNQAMYDSLVLFESIMNELNNEEAGFESGKEDGKAALARAVIAYETEMLPRARDYILRCIEDEGMFWGDDAASRLAEMFNQASGQVNVEHT